MRHCARCRAEYEEKIEVCADCGAPLAEGKLPPEQEMDWRLLTTVNTEDEAALVAGFLEAEGIEATIEPINAGNTISESIGEMARIHILVRAARLDGARRQLQAREVAFDAARGDEEAIVTDEGPAHIDDSSETAE